MAQPVKLPSGVYQLRRKVPLDLRKALGHEYKRSLRTRDPAEAKARFAEEWTRSDTVFALARAQAGGVEKLGERDLRQLAGRWYRAELEKLETSGNFALWLADGRTVAVEHGDYYEEYTPQISLREAQGDDPELPSLEPQIEAIIRTTLRSEGIPMPDSAATRESLFEAFRTHLHMLSDIALARYHGDWTAQAKVLPQEQLSIEAKRNESRTKGKSLRELFEEYAQDKTLNDGDIRGVRRTIIAYRASIDQFIELCGAGPVTNIDRQTIRAYRAYLAQLPAKGEGIRKLGAVALIAKARAEGLPCISQATIRNKLLALSAVLSYGVRTGILSENPVIAGGISRDAAKAASNRSSASRRRKDYSQEELKRIFASPIFKTIGWEPPRATFGEAWYWLPLLLYYTGARREELAQLAVRDVRHSEAENIPYLSILAAADEEDGKRGVKTAGSRRIIPLHPDLIDRGFLRYAASVADGQLFPMLKPNPSGYFGANFGKRWAVYLKDMVGLETAVTPSHGFRHTFKTLCRQVGIAEDVHDAITGHAGNDTVARDYGRMPLSRMALEIAKYPTAPGLVPILD